MSMRWVVLACLICACKRNEHANDSAPAPSTTRPIAAADTASAHAAAAPSAVPAAPSPSSAPVPAGTKRSFAAKGYTSGLRLDSDKLIYCDDRGSRALDLVSGTEGAHEGLCPTMPEERNGACGGIDYVTDVREPDQDDIIDTNGPMSIPVHGHIHDCAFNAGVLIYATGLEIVAVDVKSDHHSLKTEMSGSQVAINGAWLAWAEPNKVFAEHR